MYYQHTYLFWGLKWKPESYFKEKVDSIEGISLQENNFKTIILVFPQKLITFKNQLNYILGNQKPICLAKSAYMPKGYSSNRRIMTFVMNLIICLKKLPKSTIFWEKTTTMMMKNHGSWTAYMKQLDTSSEKLV